MARVVLGVGGGIAAYKACDLLRRFTEAGHQVRVIPTESALRFVGEPTWAALSGQPVATDVWADAEAVPHVRVGQAAELVVVAPATADLLARVATGRADDLLTATLLTARCPVLYAPAMHTEMWEHPATQANVATLRDRGAVVMPPGVGRLTGPDTGPGRLRDPADIAEFATRLLTTTLPPTDLAGRSVLVTAGGTREYLDPVRFLGNPSTGRQGYAIAQAAVERGAERVTLVAANVTLPDPPGVEVIHVETTEALRSAVLGARRAAAATVLAAAPADFRPVRYSESKIKKSGLDGMTVELTRTPDIAAELGADKKPDEVLVVFAAETHDAIENGRAKMVAKNADIAVINQVGPGRGFGAAVNEVTILGADGTAQDIPETSKLEVGHHIWAKVAALLNR